MHTPSKASRYTRSSGHWSARTWPCKLTSARCARSCSPPVPSTDRMPAPGLPRTGIPAGWCLGRQCCPRGLWVAEGREWGSWVRCRLVGCSGAPSGFCGECCGCRQWLPGVLWGCRAVLGLEKKNWGLTIDAYLCEKAINSVSNTVLFSILFYAFQYPPSFPLLLQRMLCLSNSFDMYILISEINKCALCSCWCKEHLKFNEIIKKICLKVAHQFCDILLTLVDPRYNIQVS